MSSVVRWKIMVISGSTVLGIFSVHADNRAAAKYRLDDLPEFKKFRAGLTAEVTDFIITKSSNPYECRKEGRL